MIKMMGFNGKEFRHSCQLRCCWCANGEAINRVMPAISRRTSTGVVNFGLYASTSSATGYAGHLPGPVDAAGNLTVQSWTGSRRCPGSNALPALTSAINDEQHRQHEQRADLGLGNAEQGAALTLTTSSTEGGTPSSSSGRNSAVAATDRQGGLSIATRPLAAAPATPAR